MMRKIYFWFIFHTVLKGIPLFAVIHGSGWWPLTVSFDGVGVSILLLISLLWWMCMFFFSYGFSRSVIWREMETIYRYRMKSACFSNSSFDMKNLKALEMCKMRIRFFLSLVIWRCEFIYMCVCDKHSEIFQNYY